MSEEARCYSYRDPDVNIHQSNKCLWRITRFIFTMILLILVSSVSLGGSVLTHYALEQLELSGLDKWQSDTIERILFAVPLGFAVGIISFNIRAGIAICILTICSLLVSMEAYLPSAEGHNETGVFDFLLGNYTETETHFRELAGISLWGLVLTFPSGYVLYTLGFGPTYSLSGSLVGLSYFIPINFNISVDEYCRKESCAYYLWGYLVWFVLLIISINHLCNTIRYVVAKAKQPQLLRCYQWVCYSKLYICVFEIQTFLFTVLLLISLSYFALVEQTSDEKGPIVFGILVNTLALVIIQSYRAGKCVQAWRAKKNRKRATTHETVRIVRPVAAPRQNARTDTVRPRSDAIPPPTYTQVLGAEPNLYPEITEECREVPEQLNNRILEDEHNVEGFPSERTTLLREQDENKSIFHGCYMCVFFFQRCFYSDILRVIQLLLDLTGGLSITGITAVVILAAIQGWGNPRL